MLKMAKNDSKIIALDYLKEQIITCEMPPGSVIRVEDVAEKLCISKTPVREALIELQTDGYVNIVPRKKTIVSKISLQDLKNIYDARSLIETHIIQSLSRKDVEANKNMLLRLSELWENINISGQTKAEYISFLKEDLRFHQSIIQMSGNPHLIHYCQGLIYKSQRFWYMALFNNDVQRVRKEHLQIAALILKNKPKDAAVALREHISVSKALSILSE